MSNIEYKILRPEFAGQVKEFESRRLNSEHESEVERGLAAWNSSWREESLNHYLPLGWSFGAFREGQLSGYILAQPLLFIQSLTQSLWVEHLAAESDTLAGELLNVLYRWARDKHFQQILLPRAEQMPQLETRFQVEWLADRVARIKTSRFNN